MNRFASLVKKEVLHILRDPRTMGIVLLVPVVQILLFGFAISVEINNIDFAVAAPRPTAAITEQVAKMSANTYFTFTGYVSPAEADDVLRTGRADVVLCFASDYERRMQSSDDGRPAVQLLFDASNPNVAAAGEGYVRRLFAADGASAMQAETFLMYNPQMRSAYNFVPGIMGLIFILICALMTSVSIVREKECGTLEVLLVSPVRPLRIVLAKMIPYFLLSCINLTSILLLARYALGLPLSGSVVALVALSLLYIVLSLSLGLFISTVADTQVTAMLLAGMILILPVIMLSGMVFPVENMPGVLQGVSCIVPARWYIAAVRKLMIEGLPPAATITECAILLAMTTTLVAVSAAKFNDKLEKS